VLLDRFKRVSVSLFKGKVQVDLRETYEVSAGDQHWAARLLLPSTPHPSSPLVSDPLLCLHDASGAQKDGQMLPGTKGVALTLEQWSLLRPHLPALAQAAQQGQAGGPPVDLGGMRQAYVSSYG
jgi:hypothetical protein